MWLSGVKKVGGGCDLDLTTYQKIIKRIELMTFILIKTSGTSIATTQTQSLTSELASLLIS